MKIKILKECETQSKKYKKGDVDDVENAVADAWIQAEYAEKVIDKK